jgi:hypothetical protein
MPCVIINRVAGLMDMPVSGSLFSIDIAVIQNSKGAKYDYGRQNFW